LIFLKDIIRFFPTKFLIPVTFLLIWSTGFIVAKFGLPFSPTLTFLVLRYFLVLVILIPILFFIKFDWPKIDTVVHISISGVLIHAGYLSGVWCAIKLGMPAGVAALIVGLQPLLTAFSSSFVGESINFRQWIGLILGMGGVILVLGEKVSFDGLDLKSISLCFMALLSITYGTLYQKKFCPSFDLRIGAVIQFSSSLIFTLPFAFLMEDFNINLYNVEWSKEFIFSLIWSVLALSIGAVFLLFLLIRRSAITHVSSLMYLTPPATALFAWIFFDETLTAINFLGMLLVCIGVIFVIRRYETKTKK